MSSRLSTNCSPSFFSPLNPIVNVSGNVGGGSSVDGTQNQVIVTTSATGSSVLSLPQDIGTGSTVQVGKLGIGVIPNPNISIMEHVGGILQAPTTGGNMFGIFTNTEMRHTTAKNIYMHYIANTVQNLSSTGDSKLYGIAVDGAGFYNSGNPYLQSYGAHITAPYNASRPISTTGLGVYTDSLGVGPNSGAWTGALQARGQVRIDNRLAIGMDPDSKAILHITAPPGASDALDNNFKSRAYPVSATGSTQRDFVNAWLYTNFAAVNPNATGGSTIDHYGIMASQSGLPPSQTGAININVGGMFLRPDVNAGNVRAALAANDLSIGYGVTTPPDYGIYSQGGIKFSTGSTLRVYDEGTGTVSITGASSGSIFSGTTQCGYKYSRTGNGVIIRINNISDIVLASASKLNFVLPTQLRPSTSVTVLVKAISNDVHQTGVLDMDVNGLCSIGLLGNGGSVVFPISNPSVFTGWSSISFSYVL